MEIGEIGWFVDALGRQGFQDRARDDPRASRSACEIG